MYESDRRNEKIIEEYRTSWLSYSEISQLAASWREKMEEWEKLKSVDIRTVNRDGDRAKILETLEKSVIYQNKL